ncbi:hypothetical protein Pmani_029971 [Petrolisthes manimaculis]|uniref:C2 domain-containing protein n=1 Tax=Petrolisthes manimaculis TaxID=1843537 RepID=A0AAE1NY95_9EUCA|nr:hypothetical protein Pmani_029971 [Petrolisthes manimaculis]
MFSSRKDEKVKKPRRGGGNLAQFGLMDVPNLDTMGLDDGDGEDDSALEAELLALTGGGGGGGRRKQPNRGKGTVSTDQLAQMVSECMRDDQGDDDMLDEDDPELLAELSALSPDYDSDDQSTSSSTTPAARPSPPARSDYRNPEPMAPRQAPMAAGISILAVLAERRAMYEQAEATAISAGETSRARRFSRGLKTIVQMEKSVRAGRGINEDEIPPMVVVRGGGGGSGGSNTPAALSPSEDSTPPPVPRHAPAPAPTSIPHDVVFEERERRPQPQPRISPVKQQDNSGDTREPAQRPAPAPPQPFPHTTPPPTTTSSDPASVIRCLHDQYKAAALSAKRRGDRDKAVQYLRTMKQLDPMLTAAINGQPVDLTTLPASPSLADSQLPMSSAVAPKPAPMETVSMVGNGDSAGTPPTAPAPTTGPTTIIEALEQRLAKYTEQRDKAKSEENARKERMNQRIMKQYEDAIKKHKASKPVDYEDLPTPPGFAPIPVGPSAPGGGGVGTGGQPDPNQQQQQQQGGTQPPTNAVQKPAPPPPTNVRQTPKSRVERQMSLLTKRQGQFKQAALEAKKRGEIEQAKEYLRMSKGFDQLIEATRGGLPVDMNTVPVPPQEQITSLRMSPGADFELVTSEDCVTSPENTNGDTAVTYTKLEEDLIAQIKMCAETREHFKATGDVASANRFEQLILHTKKDLDAVRAGFKRGSTPPRFHYETRSFNIIQCNTDLNDSDCEVVVVRGINFNVQNPKDVDTYVRIEFPYPSDNPPQDRCYVVKDTNNPEYNHKTVFSIDRKSRALARVFKRHSLKLHVYAKGGWFHRDTILGTVKAPLVTLETKCTLHDSFDLMDERKRMVGGKLEVKVRVRNPIVTKQLEKVSEKWLVIDGF